MSRMVHGNLAVQQAPAVEEGVAVKRKTVTRKVSIPAKEKLLYLLVIMFCMAVTGGIIFKYAQIYQINTTIHEVEADIQALHKENQTLRLEIRQLQEPKRLLEEGRNLGFTPSEEDVVSLVSPLRQGNAR